MLVALAVAGCSCGTTNHPANPSDEQVVETPTLVAPDAVVLDRLIAPTTMTIERRLPPHAVVEGMTPGCGTLVSAYTVSVPSGSGATLAHYQILEGDLPDDCFPGTAVRRRPPFTVVGPADLVVSATTATSATPSRWHDVLGAIPAKAPIWIGSQDRLFEQLFGVATAHYEIAFERVELAPNMYFDGRATATYTTAGDAAIVARRIKTGEVTLPGKSAEVAESFKRMRVKQTATVVSVTFDLGMFGGIPAEDLQALAAKLPH